MRKFVLFLTLTTGMSGTAMAEGWEFSQSGTAGLYYGITEDRDRHNIRNSPNRTVFAPTEDLRLFMNSRPEFGSERPPTIRWLSGSMTLLIRRETGAFIRICWRRRTITES